MKGKAAWLASAAVVALVFSSAAAQAGSNDPKWSEQQAGPSNADLEARIEALEAELQNAEIRQAKDRDAYASAASKLDGWWSNTSISGRMYFDITNVDHDVNGVKGTDNGVGFDIKRFYFGVDHKFDDVWSANLTTDFQYDSTAKVTQLYIKKAYLRANISPALDVRLGSTDLPWVPFAEGVYGYRHIENTLIDRTKFGTSADWGVHASGKFGGMFEYAVAVINGAGYKAPPGSNNATHFKSVDVEGRLSAKVDDFVLAVGGYTGKLGKDVQGAVTHHTATRFDALAAYKTKTITLGVEYFYGSDWNNVTTIASDKAQGWSGFASYQFDPQWSVFGRYDWVQPNQDTNSPLKDKYFNVGVQWSPTKIVDLSLVYKHDEADHGTLATSNGTIGGAVVGGSYDEVGIFGQLRW